MAFIDVLNKFKYRFPNFCGFGANSVVIRHSENTLGLKFPEMINDYLKTLGHISVGLNEIWGLGDDLPIYRDLTRMTISEREEVNPGLPHYLLPFQNDGAGNLYCALIQDENLIDPIMVIWDHELTEAVKLEGEMTFSLWIESIIRDERTL
jgi:hypothetical protein